MKKTLFICFICFLSSCSNEEKLLSNEKEYSLNSNCSPGLTSIENGMLKFPNADEFNKTIDFLKCATLQEIESWENSISLMTTSKFFRQFQSQLCNGNDCPELTDAQLDDLINQYQGKIRITGEGDDREYRVKYEGYNEFSNENGYFKVGECLIAITANKLISILDGDISKVQIALNTNQNNISEGIYIHDILLPSPTGPLCDSPCPISDSKETKTSDSEYRYKVMYQLVNLSLTFPAIFCNTPNVDVSFRLVLKVDGAAEKHRWLRGWVCSSLSRSAHNWLGSAEIKHNFTNFSSPFNWNLDANWDWNCFVSKEIELSQGFLCIHPINVPERNVCLEKFVLNATATRRNLEVSYNCQ